jgi:hypothetical protein
MSDRKARLKQEFHTIRQEFFPRWDRAKRWRIRRVADLNGANGQAHPDTRTIRITHLPEGDEGTLLLIHEIAHAVGNWGHGKKWQARIEQAAKAAEKMGRTELAGLLRKEIAGYRDPVARVTARLAYQEIADAAAEAPDATFLQVVDCLRRDYGLSRREFLSRFRRARAVFDREKRDEEERARSRAKWMGARQREQ